MILIKLSTIFVIVMYIISVSTLNIHKSKRVLRKPLRVLVPPDSDISTENKYLLTATYGIKQSKEVLNKSSEDTYDNEENEQGLNKSSEQTYNIQVNEQVPNTSSVQTYNIKEDEEERTEDTTPVVPIIKNENYVFASIGDYYYSKDKMYNIQEDEQVPNTSSEQTYNIKEDEEVPNNTFKQTYNSKEDKQILNKNSKQVYNVEEHKQEPRKSSVRIDSYGTNFNNVKNEHDNSQNQKIFAKRTEETTPVVPIIKNENYVFAYNGDYHYSYKGGDGTQVFERGDRRAANEGTADDVVVGGYSYKDKDGNDYSLTYTAGENGYRPEGAHLPTPPPIPPAIQRVLRILATKTTPEPVTESLNSYDYN